MSTGLWGLRLYDEDKLNLIPEQAQPSSGYSFSYTLVTQLANIPDQTLQDVFKAMQPLDSTQLHEQHGLNNEELKFIARPRWRSHYHYSQLRTSHWRIRKRLTWQEVLCGLYPSFYVAALQENVRIHCAAGNASPLDSTSCHYLYLLNLDSSELEFHIGNNRNPRCPGRYAEGRSGGAQTYSGIRLALTVPLRLVREQSQLVHAFLCQADQADTKYLHACDRVLQAQYKLQQWK